jgi:hypothetical protein
VYSLTKATTMTMRFGTRRRMMRDTPVIRICICISRTPANACRYLPSPNSNASTSCRTKRMAKHHHHGHSTVRVLYLHTHNKRDSRHLPRTAYNKDLYRAEKANAFFSFSFFCRSPSSMMLCGIKGYQGVSTRRTKDGRTFRPCGSCGVRVLALSARLDSLTPSSGMEETPVRCVCSAF